MGLVGRARELIGSQGMPRMFVTCPESAHIAELEYEDHPLGMLISGCSHFTPSCAVACARACAARIDQRRRMFAEEEVTDPGDDEDFDPVKRLTQAFEAGGDIEIHIETDLAEIVIG